MKLLLALALLPAVAWSQARIDQTNCSGASPNWVLTLSGCAAPTIAGSGVASFGSTANVGGLFTTSVANANSNPFQTITIPTTAAHQFWGNSSASTGTPSFAQPNFTDLAGAASATQIAAAQHTLSNTFYATDSTYTGADFGATVANALAAAYAAGGGTVDARGFTCPASCHVGTADLTIGDATHWVTILWPVGTITLDTITSLGRRAQILYNSRSTQIGQGIQGGTIISGAADATYPLEQAAYAASYSIQNVGIYDLAFAATGTPSAGSVAFELAGFVPGAAHGVSVLSSVISNVFASGADVGIQLDGYAGCDCYNHFYNMTGRGVSFGARFLNHSLNFGDFNSNTWIGGQTWGNIGFMEAAGGLNTFLNLDIEGSTSSTGNNALDAQVTSVAGGSGIGYTLNDIVTPVSGCTVEPTFRINYVNGSGNVGRSGQPALSVVTGGSGCPNFETNVPVTGGTGNGLLLNIASAAGYYELGSANTSFGFYEEANAGDIICGSFNYQFSSLAGSGSSYSPNSCPGTTNAFGGPASNFFWGPASSPASIGIHGPQPYIAMGSTFQYDTGTGQLIGGNTTGTNLWADGPAWASSYTVNQGTYGHSTWNVGLSKPHAGTIATGKTSYNQIANPAVPTLAIFGTDTSTTSSPYSLVCNDLNGGTTLPATPVTTIAGPAVLGQIQSLGGIYSGGSGFVSGDVGATVTFSGGDGTATGTITAVSGGAVTGVSLVTGGSQYILATPGATTYGILVATGGTGTGLRVRANGTGIQVNFPATDGCNSWTVLKGDTTHKLDLTKAGSTNESTNWIDFGNGTVAYTPGTRNTTGDVSVAGQVNVGNGTNVVYRCTTAGTLPVGALTTGSANCGASVATSLNVN